MKKYIFISLCFVFFSLIVSAQGNFRSKLNAKDSTVYHRVNFCFTWFEVGGSIPLKEKKLNDLAHGLNTYLYDPKGGMVFNLFGIGFYYKNHWGISVIYSSQDFTVKDADFRNYISSKYPNYFLPEGVQGHTYTLYDFNYRLSYRFHKGHFIFEPQFQLGINDCDDFTSQFILKENGSNNFIEYSIINENNKKNQFSYRAGIVVRWRHSKPTWKWNIEPGLRCDFMVVPTDYNYTVTSSPYNMPATVEVVRVKQLRPAINIAIVASVFKK